MKKILYAGKLMAIAILGILGIQSIMMFPFLIGNEDSEASIIGYSYLGILLFSTTSIYFMVRNELKAA
jgi:hypothetical protein